MRFDAQRFIIIKSHSLQERRAGPSTSLTRATYTSMNRLDSQQPGGPMRFAGTINEPASVTLTKSSVTTQAQPKWTGLFAGTFWLTAGSNTGIAVAATDLGAGSGNLTTSTYDVEVSGTTNSDFTYDDNGNMTYDGTRTYTWDVENRLLTISFVNYVGTHLSEFSYDGYSRRIEIKDKLDGDVVSDHKFIWCGASICEERDSDGTTVLRDYFAEGVMEGSTPYYYHRDHLGSVREVTDSTGTVVARYDYDPYGRRTKIDGDYNAPNGYTGHFTHDVSGLVLTLYRAYDPNIGRWLSEDPIGLGGGINYYSYVGNGPINNGDPLGLFGEELANDVFGGRVSMAVLEGYGNFYGGFADNLTFGGVSKINNALGNGGFTDKCSGLYKTGEWAGVAWWTALGASAGSGGAAGASADFSGINMGELTQSELKLFTSGGKSDLFAELFETGANAGLNEDAILAYRQLASNALSNYAAEGYTGIGVGVQAARMQAIDSYLANNSAAMLQGAGLGVGIGSLSKGKNSSNCPCR